MFEDRDDFNYKLYEQDDVEDIPYENAYLPQPVPQTVYEHNPTPKKKNNRLRFAAVIVAICTIGSLVSGFLGSYIGNSFSSSTLTTQSDGTVLYQSVSTTNVENAATEELSVADVAATVSDSVVEITTEVVTTNGRMGQLISEGAGSGVIISTDGYIVTNNHVIADAQTITVRLTDGNEYNAVLIGTDASTDVAVIRIEASNLQPAVMGDSSSLVVGQTAIAVGNPLGELGGTVTEGIISALDREITVDGETMSLLQTDTAINPGNSGGGLFNLYGELIGIVNAKSSGSDIEGLGFAIPINTAKTIIEEIISNGYVTGRVDTGLTVVDIQDTQTAMSYGVNKLGLYIAQSTSSSLQSGDIITEIDGNAVSNLSDYNSILNNYSVGDTIEITVTRSGRSMTFSLTLGEQTA